MARQFPFRAEGGPTSLSPPLSYLCVAKCCGAVQCCVCEFLSVLDNFVRHTRSVRLAAEALSSGASPA
jgi:hypothetical protein